MDTALQHTIVVGVDGSLSALRATRWAAREAAARHAPLLLLHACPVPRVHHHEVRFAPGYRNGLLGFGYEALSDAREAALAEAPGVQVSTRLRVDPPAAVLIAAGRTARLLVLGSRGLGGVSGLVLGSVAVAAASKAECPVVVIPHDDRSESEWPGRPVVVGVDGAQLDNPAVEFAFDAASARGVPLVAVHVRDESMTDAQRLLSERLAGWREKYLDVEVRPTVRTGRPAPALVEESRSAQLVVVGSRGRRGLAGLTLGSVSHALLHHSHCPVAIARPSPGT